MKRQLKTMGLNVALAVALMACGGSATSEQPAETTTGGSVEQEMVETTPVLEAEASATSEPASARATEPEMESVPTEVAVEVEPTATMMAEEEVAAQVEDEATTVSVPDEMVATREAGALPTATMEAAPTEAPVAANLPVYLGSELTDVNSGEPFRVADLTAAGNYVLLETMAVWCSNCRQQQEQVKLYEATGPADVVSVALDIDLNESPDLLREHATQGGFDWRYAVATQEVALGINTDFGPQFLTPPSVPMLLIRPDNSIVQLPFGIKSAEELAALVEQNRLN